MHDNYYIQLENVKNLLSDLTTMRRSRKYIFLNKTFIVNKAVGRLTK